MKDSEGREVRLVKRANDAYTDFYEIKEKYLDEKLGVENTRIRKVVFHTNEDGTTSEEHEFFDARTQKNVHVVRKTLQGGAVEETTLDDSGTVLKKKVLTDRSVIDSKADTQNTAENNIEKILYDAQG